MTSKYAMTSNVGYDEKMHNDASKIRHSEPGSAISDCLVLTMFSCSNLVSGNMLRRKHELLLNVIS